MNLSFFRLLNRCVIFNIVGILLTASPPAFLTSTASAQPTGFVTRQDSAEVVIVDLSSGTVLGTIPTLDTSPFEIALSTDASTLFVTTLADTVNFLDTASASLPQRVGVGSVPIEIAPLPDGSKLYTADFLGGTVSVVDTATAANVATIPTAFLSYDVATAPDGTRVYATALQATGLFVIDTATDTVVDQIPVGRTFLGHVAITPDGQKAYVTEFRNQVNVIDLASRMVIRSIPFIHGPANPNNGALDIEIDPQGAFAYVLGFDTVNVIDLATDTLVATVPIGIQLSDVVIDSTGAFVYVTTLHQTAPLVPFNEIVKIDTSDFTIQDRFVIGGLLVGLAVEPSAIAALDHFLSYKVRRTKGTPKFEKQEVTLTDQFKSDVLFEVKKSKELYNPADKNGEGIIDPDTHLVGYEIKRAKTDPPQPKHVERTNIEVVNQFGTIFVDTKKPDRLLVPSLKDLDIPIPDIDVPDEFPVDHFKCYKVKVSEGSEFPEGIQVDVVDEFNQPKLFDVKKPKRLCNPVDKNGEGIINPDAHLMCYKVKPAENEPKHIKVTGIHVNNQFGPLQLDTKKEAELCVSSTKTLP